MTRLGRGPVPAGRWAIYVRYSSDRQREASIEDQVRICRARAEREGWDVAVVHTDYAVSGATALRPGFQALQADLRAGAVDVVLAENLDRLSRDQEHIAGFFKRAAFSAALRERLVALERHAAELEAELVGAEAPAPRLHPGLAEAYRARVAELPAALAADDGAELRERVRALVEEVRLVPKGFKLLAEGARNAKGAHYITAVSALREQTKMGAGAGFEPAAFRL